MHKEIVPLSVIPVALSVVVWLTGLTCANGARLQIKQEDTVILENEYWRVMVEPQYGGRCRSFYSKTYDNEFVLYWPQTEDKSSVEMASGGVFSGNMCGSYESEQVNEPYSVIKCGPTRLAMRYNNEHPLFSGLREDRVVSLVAGGRTVQLDLKVTNRSGDKRTLYYRLHELLGTGNQNGSDSIYLTPAKGGEIMAIASSRAPKPEWFSQRVEFFFTPEEPWFAMVDLTRDLGMLVEIERSPVQQIFYWLGTPRLRTAEVFFPITLLRPGQSWKVRLRYTAFSPSEADLGDPRLNKILSAGSVREYLRRYPLRRYRTGLPMQAKMHLLRPEQEAAVSPVHPADPQHGTQYLQFYAGSLDKITLYGSPGEVVPLAFAVRALREIKGGRIEFTELSNERNVIPAQQFDARHVSQDGWGYLVRDWKLARTGLPQDVGRTNNNIRDSEVLTPFDLEAEETAFLWSYLRIPQDAEPGSYTARCSVSDSSNVLEQFRIELVVYPFCLTRPKNKICGAFTRYKLKTGAPDEPATSLTQEEYLACLKNMGEMGYNGMTIYDNSREKILWILDQCADLGWKDCLFLFIHADAVDPDELDQRYGHHRFKFLGWLVDEPTQYKRIPEFRRRLQQVSSRWGNRCMFTPNTPLGIAMAEENPQTVPNFAHMGTAPYLVDLTRRYRTLGRETYWYGMPWGKPTAYKRLMRGICLWKEPVNGILDWGEDTMIAPPGLSLAGFAGTKIIPTIARENIRQGYYDLYYLHTLQQVMDSADDNDPLKGQARDVLERIRNQFHFVFSAEADRFTQGYLDMIRREVARQISNLQRPQRLPESSRAP